MADRKQPAEERDKRQVDTDKLTGGGAVQPPQPKPESTAEYEGAEKRKPTGNPPVETKTETSKDSGQ